MTEMIVLTTAEAEILAGASCEGHALEPRALTDGETWVLPVAVLADPAHAARLAALATLPTRVVLPSEFPADE